MTTLGSVVSERDYFVEGLSLKDLGIDLMNRDELLRCLREGF